MTCMLTTRTRYCTYGYSPINCTAAVLHNRPHDFGGGTQSVCVFGLCADGGGAVAGVDGERVDGGMDLFWGNWWRSRWGRYSLRSSRWAGERIGRSVCPYEPPVRSQCHMSPHAGAGRKRLCENVLPLPGSCPPCSTAIAPAATQAAICPGGVIACIRCCGGPVSTSTRVDG